MVDATNNHFERGMNVACNLPGPDAVRMVSELEQENGIDGICGYTVRGSLVHIVPQLREHTAKELVWDTRMLGANDRVEDVDIVDIARTLGVSALGVFPYITRGAGQDWEDTVRQARDAGIKPIVSPQSGAHDSRTAFDCIKTVINAHDQLDVVDFGVRGNEASVPFAFQRQLSRRPGVGNYTLYLRHLMMRNRQPYVVEQLNGNLITVVGNAICKYANTDVRTAAYHLAEIVTIGSSQSLAGSRSPEPATAE